MNIFGRNRNILLLGGLLLTYTGYSQAMLPDSFARQLANNLQAQLIDVRTADEFVQGHLPDAKNIDYKRADFDRLIKALDKQKPVYVYCLSGGRSKAAAEQLRSLGYGPVYELTGGYLKWSAKLLPVEGVQRSSSPSQWSPERLDSLVRAQALVLVDVYASWCAPCQKMAPILDKLTTEWTSKAVILKINADLEKSLLKHLQVEELPTLLLFRNGSLVQRTLGFQDEPAIRSLLNAK